MAGARRRARRRPASLRFAAGAGALDPSLLPPDAAAAPDGAIVELAPARTALMEAIAARIASHGGAGLFIDYGHLAVRPSATRCRRSGRIATKMCWTTPARPISPRMSTSPRSRHAPRRHGLDAHLSTQGDFLLGMGLLERAGVLGADADAAARERLQGEVERLAGADAMGTLFKVLAIAPAGIRAAALHRGSD